MLEITHLGFLTARKPPSGNEWKQAYGCYFGRVDSLYSRVNLTWLS